MDSSSRFHGEPAEGISGTGSEGERLRRSEHDLIEARESHREIEERYRTAFENTGTAMMVIEEDTTISMWNHKLEEVTGYSDEDALKGRKWIDFILEDDLPRLLEYHTARSRDPGLAPAEYEFRLKHKSGEIRDISIAVGTIPNSKRRIVSLTDITLRKRMEEKVRESEREYRDLFENANDMIYVHDMQGNITSANAAALQGLGYTIEDLGKVNIGQLVEPQYMPFVTRLIADLTETSPRSARVEIPVFTRDRVRIWIETSIRAIWNKGACIGIQGIARDVTERKKAEEQKLAIAREETEKARSVIRDLQKELVTTRSFQSMVSRSPAMKQVFDLLPEVAQAEIPVLILGESGTGKELLARSVHELSRRKEGPFVAVNCSALPDTLLESELFGYVAGAFTGAKKDKPGRFALAEGGTLFLDEIGDISLSMQAKLLRVLQEKEYQPLGSTHSAKADVRIVAATNKDFQALVKSRTIREDFYYRINVMPINLPPLRERRCDIPLLCAHLIEQFNARYSKAIREVSEEVMDLFLRHEFPGNIRELENVMEHAFVFCKESIIGLEHLPPDISAAAIERNRQAALSSVKNFAELERLFIESVLAQTGGNKLEASRRLGVDKTTLFRKIRRLGIKAQKESPA